jgi:hypothetical protein
MTASKWDWHKFLNEEEAKFIAMVEEAKANWLELNKSRMSIKNRAIQRAMYYERHRSDIDGRL